MITQPDGPIVYIDDDEDDQLLFGEAIRELLTPNPTRFFSSSLTAIRYLETTDEKPLLILCDINMPDISGIELSRYIDANDYLRKKAIPFIYYTTAATPGQVNQAYEGTIQGFLVKAQEFAQLKRQIELMVNYWQSCLHPDSF